VDGYVSTAPFSRLVKSTSSFIDLSGDDKGDEKLTVASLPCRPPLAVNPLLAATPGAGVDFPLGSTRLKDVLCGLERDVLLVGAILDTSELYDLALEGMRFVSAVISST
jgi:hypothetical protein